MNLAEGTGRVPSTRLAAGTTLPPNLGSSIGVSSGSHVPHSSCPDIPERRADEISLDGCIPA
jgi:hypothetical protein